MSLPLELQKLPPQALDVIRYLDGKEDGASVDAIMAGTGLSERSVGKAIRRLVTRYYASMPGEGVYLLTRLGRQAADDLRQYDGPQAAAESVPAESMPAPQKVLAPTTAPQNVAVTAVTPPPAPLPAVVPPPVPQPAAAPASAGTKVIHTRRLSVLMAQEFVLGASAMLMIGFDGPSEGSTPLPAPVDTIIRVSAPGCDVEPAERPLEVTVDKAVGPVQFRVKAQIEETVRVKIEVFQQVSLQDLRPAGGMYFDMEVSVFPTIKSAELHAVGAMVQLESGA
ncbi:MAG TPA: hypothetical protein VHP83_19440 [Aggregatilineaceae bacterium]|nr:hypothetical protein [Aggregatilineaceae bacterium]